MKTRLMRSLTSVDPSLLMEMMSWKSAIRQLCAERGTVNPNKQNKKSDKSLIRRVIEVSRGAALECSPRREPWVESRRKLSPGGAEEWFRINKLPGGGFVDPVCEPLFRPVGA